MPSRFNLYGFRIQEHQGHSWMMIAVRTKGNDAILKGSGAKELFFRLLRDGTRDSLDYVVAWLPGDVALPEARATGATIDGFMGVAVNAWGLGVRVRVARVAAVREKLMPDAPAFDATNRQPVYTKRYEVSRVPSGLTPKQLVKLLHGLRWAFVPLQAPWAPKGAPGLAT